MLFQAPAKVFRKKHINMGQQLGSAKGQFFQPCSLLETLQAYMCCGDTYLFYTILTDFVSFCKKKIK